LKKGLGFALGILVPAVCVAIFLFLCVSLLQTKPTEPPKKAAKKVVREALRAGMLSCGDVVALGEWSLKKYGGGKQVNWASKTFGMRAARLFVEKLDSERLLFTEEEVASFEARVRSEWTAVTEKQNCELFQTWLTENYPRAQRRFWSSVRAADLSSAKKENVKNRSRFKLWAKGEADLKSRIQEYTVSTLGNASSKVLAAYRGNLHGYLKVVLEEGVINPSVDAEKLLAKSVLGSIDNFSTYFSKEEFEDFYADLAGSTSGIGIRVSKVPAGLMIEKILSGSAAAQSKQLAEGDVIKSVDDIRVENLSFTQAKHLLKGPEESFVKLKVSKVDSQETREVTIQRKQFTFEDSRITGRFVKPVAGKTPVAVVSIPNFYGRGGMGSLSEERSSFEDLQAVLHDLLQGEKRNSPVVLDLRGNPGGYLEEAVAMAGMFLGSQPVVGVVENERTRVMKEESPEVLDHDGAIVLLVDEGTASASEVLAGALKDHQRAILVGSRRTFGKGSVQKLFHLDDPLLQVGLGNTVGNGVLKLTTSVFYSPLGHSPANGGVKTHITLSDTSGDLAPENFVPEISPLLDEQALALLQGREEKTRAQVIALQKSLETQASSAFSNAEDKELAEAVLLAADAQELRKTSSNATR
jgi:C-terminal peptidase prc